MECKQWRKINLPHPALILGHPPVRLHSSNSAAPRDSPFSECLSWEWHPVSTGRTHTEGRRQGSSTDKHCARWNPGFWETWLKTPIYTAMQIPHRIGGLKPTELNPMPCYNLKAGFVLPCKADLVSLLLELFFPPYFLPSATRKLPCHPWLVLLSHAQHPTGLPDLWRLVS